MRFFYTFLICFIFQFSYSKINNAPVDISYEQALLLAKKENKPIFIMLYANWCPHCNTMKSTVLKEPKIVDFLSRNYIYLWKDIENEEGLKIKDKYKTQGLPTFLFLDANETVLYSVKGKMTSDVFMQEVNNALNPNLQLPYLKSQFLKDPSNATACLNYIQTLRKGVERTELAEATHLYLATQTDKQLLSETNWRIIANGVSDITSREFQYVLKNRMEFEKLISVKRVDAKITNIVSELLQPYTLSLDTTAYFKNRLIAKTITLENIQSLIFSYDILIAERTSNWDFYKKATLEGTKKYVWDSDNKLKEIGQIYYKEISEPSALQSAILWVKRALEINNSADGNLLIARLYSKINDKKSAQFYAKNAQTITKEMSWDSSESDTFLKELNTK